MHPILKYTAICALLLPAVAVLSGFSRKENNISRYKTGSYKTTINDFEFIKYSGNANIKGEKKDIYRHKDTGKQWILSQQFGKYEFASYLAGGLYQLILEDRSPSIALIQKQDGNYALGSEFIEDFKNIGEFFGETDSDLIAYTHQEENGLPTLSDEQTEAIKDQIEGIEDVIAATIILGDYDLHKKNMGVIPSVTHPGKYQAAKVDHDMCFYLIQHLHSLSQQKIPVFERVPFNPEIIDLDKLSLAFERIANIDDKLWEQSIQERLDDLKNSGQFDEEAFNIYNHARWWKGEVFEGDRDILTIMVERKKQAAFFAKSLKVEASIRSGNLEKLQTMIQDGTISTSDKYESLFLEEAMGGPIPLSKMAKAYEQEAITNYLTFLAQADERELDTAILSLANDIIE